MESEQRRIRRRRLAVVLAAGLAVFAVAVYALPLLKQEDDESADPDQHPTREMALLDLDGQEVNPLRIEGGKVMVYIFIRRDCPIANRYAPTIHKLQERFEPQGVSFCLVYPDPNATPDLIRQHMQEYSHECQALRDPDHALALWAGANITPEAVVVLPDHDVAYRGRIDNRWVDFGTARPKPTTHDLEAALTSVLAGNPVAVPTTTAVGCFIDDLR